MMGPSRSVVHRGLSHCIGMTKPLAESGVSLALALPAMLEVALAIERVVDRAI
jgi:hypothetical protein